MEDSSQQYCYAWTMVEDEMLIYAIKQNRFLYDVTMKEYKNQKLKDVTWKKVAQEVPGRTSEECQKRWKNLRERFMKEKRGRIKRPGSPPRSSSLFEFMAFYEDFCRPRSTYYVRKRRSMAERAKKEAKEQKEVLSGLQLHQDSNSDYLNGDSESCSDVMATAAPELSNQEEDEESASATQFSSSYALELAEPESKPTLPDEEQSFNEKLLQALTKRPDAEEHYALSLAARLRALEPRTRAQLKIKIENLFCEAEFPGSTGLNCALPQELKKEFA